VEGIPTKEIESVDGVNAKKENRAERRGYRRRKATKYLECPNSVFFLRALLWS